MARIALTARIAMQQLVPGANQAQAKNYEFIEHGPKQLKGGYSGTSPAHACTLSMHTLWVTHSCQIELADTANSLRP